MSPKRWFAPFYPGPQPATPRLESSGVRVVIAKGQAEDLSGTVVDYREGPEPGFQICRLHA